MSGKKWVLIGILTSVVVVLVLTLVFTVGGSGGDSDDEPTTAAPAAPPASSSAPTPTPKIGSDLIGRPVTIVDAPGGQPVEQTGEPAPFPEGVEAVPAPSGLSLQQVPSGVTLMVSDSDGPTAVEGDVMTGYAQSPVGAALVTANYMGLGFEFGPVYADFFEHYARQLVAEDPALLDEIRARGQANDGRALKAAEGYSAPRWFRFSSCTPEFCTVEAAMPSVADVVGSSDVKTIDVSPTAHPVVRLSLAWEDGEWQMVSTQSLPPVDELDGSWVLWI